MKWTYLLNTQTLSILLFSWTVSINAYGETINTPPQTLLVTSKQIENSLGKPLIVAKSGQIQTSDGKYPIGRSDLKFYLQAHSEIPVVVNGQTLAPGQTITIKDWNFSANQKKQTHSWVKNLSLTTK